LWGIRDKERHLKKLDWAMRSLLFVPGLSHYKGL